jgi:hypothetical protein
MGMPPVASEDALSSGMEDSMVDHCEAISGPVEQDWRSGRTRRARALRRRRGMER